MLPQKNLNSKSFQFIVNKKFIQNLNFLPKLTLDPLFLAKYFLNMKFYLNQECFFGNLKKKKNLFCPNFFLNQSFRPKKVDLKKFQRLKRYGQNKIFFEKRVKKGRFPFFVWNLKLKSLGWWENSEIYFGDSWCICAAIASLP